MFLASPATILAQAKTAWKTNAAENRHIVLLHAAAALGLPLVVMAINLLLNQPLLGTGGLSGIGFRSILETVQTVLSSATQILLPFWQLGLFCSALWISRGEEATTDHLFEGFRRWGAALRLMLLRTLQYSIRIFVGIFIGSTIFMITPFSENFLKVTAAIANDPAYANATAEELMAAIVNLAGFWDIALCYILCILGAAVLAVPLFYRYRMSDYVLLDSPRPGALLALQKSAQMMRGNAKRLFALDLKLWWYYLLLLLPALLSYGDLLLPALGIRLPLSGDWALAVFSLLSSAIQFAIYYLFRGQVETAYACAYESLKTTEGGNAPL